LFNRRSLGDAVWILFGIGGALGLGIILGSWFVIAPVGFKFGVFEYHTLRSAGGLMPALVYKAGFISRLVQAYLFAIVAGLALLAWRYFFPTTGNTAAANFQSLEDKEGATGIRQSPVTFAIWLSLAAITLVHFAAPFPYDDYQVPLFPLFAAVLAAAAVSLIAWQFDEARAVKACGWLLVVVFLGSAAAAGSSQMNMDWFIRGRDRIWWRMKDQPPIAKLRQAANFVRTVVPDAKEILTQDSYLAIEAGLGVPHGLEMGPFSYFPNFSDERAEALHVVNEKGLRDILRTTQAPIAAISGYGFAIACPEVSELSKDEQKELQSLVESRYTPAGVMSDFGQGSTTLKMYLLGGKATEQTPPGDATSKAAP
jgi:hypothetical protein